MRKFVFAFCVGVMAATSSPAQDEPYKNPDLSPQERADDLLKRLTLKEKISLMQNQSPGVERLGIKPYNWWSEALHGVARNGLATVYPITMGMASVFDDKLIEDIYVTVSDEGRAKFHDARRHGRYGRGNEGLTFWNPNVNIFRDPRWGRGQETWGEDPYLTTRMGVAVVRGMQGPADAKYDKTHACAKHYAVHSGPEAKRHSFDVENLEPRDLWETYLPAFKALVQEADVKEVMCAYQRFEGEPCCGSNRLLTQILRDEWGYKHLVVSDCGAISDFFYQGRHETHPDAATSSASAVINGTDLECGVEYAHLDEAVERGLITEHRIDTSLRRLLEARFALGEMDDDALVPWSRISIDTVDCGTHRRMALDVTRKSMVLLHNNGILPLDKGDAGKIAVMGPNAVDSVMQWGNYKGVPAHTYTILEGIRGAIGNVPYEKGCELLDNHVFDSYYNKVSHDGRPGMKATYWNNMEMRGEVAATQELPSPISLSNGGHTVFTSGVGLENFTAVYEGTFRPEVSDKYTLAVEGDDGYRVYVNGEKVIDYWGEHSSAKRMMDICRASCSMPLATKTVFVDGIPYVDGGVADSIPIIHSLKTGHQRNVIILTRNKGYRKHSSGKQDRLFELAYGKKYPKLVEVLEQRAKVYNKTLYYIDKWEKEGKVFVLRPEIEPVARLERDTQKLENFYQHGYDLMEEKFEEMKWFLNR